MDKWIYALDMALSYGVSGYVMLKFMFELFRPKYKKIYYGIVWVAFVICAIFFNRLNITLLKSSYGIFSIMIIGVFFFTDPSKKKIVGACLFFFLYMFIIDTISVLVLTLFSGKTVEMIQNSSILLFICGIGNQVILLCLYKPLVTVMKRNKFDAITMQQNLFLVILAFFEILLLIYILKYIDTGSNNVISMGMMIGFLGLDLYLIYLFEAISQKYKLEKEIDLREQQEVMLISYYESIETQYERMRRLIHDMKNHMQILEELYVQGNKEEAEQYTKTIYAAMEHIGSRFKCSNRILTIIVNDKLLKCDEKRINAKIEMEDVNLDFMDAFDITTIFSNIFDNAIEACEHLPIERRKLSLKVFCFNNFITINLINNHKEKLIHNGDNYISTKSGHHMGLGLKNVKTTVEKYEGTFQCEDDNDQFKIKILFSQSE